MSDSNRVQLSYGVEATWGIHPGGTLKDIRYTGESLKQATNTVSSQEIRSDRNIPDLLRTGINGDGDINFEMSHPESTGFWSDFLRGVMMSADWASGGVITTTSIAVSSVSGNTATVTIVATNFTSGMVGSWFKISGMANAGNNTAVKMIGFTSTTVASFLFAATPVAETANASGVLTRGAHVRNGTAVPTAAVSGSQSNSFTIEKRFADLSSEFEIMKGVVFDRFSFTVAADQIITASLSALAKNMVSASVSGGSGYTAVGSQNVYSGVDDVLAVVEGNTVLTCTNITAQIANNLRSRLEIGQLGATSIGAGSVNATGTLQAYYSSKTIVDKYLNGTASSLAIVFRDSSGDLFIVDFPRIKYSSGQRVAGGINTDILMDMAFQALYGSATENWTVSMTRI